MEIRDESLPIGWKNVRLPDISDIILGQSPPGTTYNEIGDGLPFFQGNADFGKIHPNVRVWCSAPRKTAHPENILLSVRAPIGAVNIANQVCAIGRGLTAFQPKGALFNRYLYYYLFYIRENLEGLGRGSTFTSITKEDLVNLIIPLPTLEEQHHIVHRIEKLLARVEAAKERLNRVPTIMQQFRQSVLAAACSGRLTDKWRIENDRSEDSEILIKKIEVERSDLIKKKIVKPLKYARNYTNNTEKFIIPDKWRWSTLGELCHVIADGPHVSPEYVTKEDGIPFLSARNVKIDKFDLSTVKYISESDYLQYSKRIKPKSGDILYTKGGTTGIARVNDLSFDIHVWVHIAVLQFSQKYLNPYYLSNALNSQYCYKQSQLFTQGITNHDLGLSRMVYIQIPLPPIEEQNEIVHKINARFAHADRIEAQVEIARERVDTITQSILHQAFTGRLVPTKVESG